MATIKITEKFRNMLPVLKFRYGLFRTATFCHVLLGSPRFTTAC